jgi:S-DNA-T family DNA segregation ATPase FtsK/SpoIIIE
MRSNENNSKQKKYLEEVYDTNDISNKEYIKEYIHVVLLSLIFCLLISVITFNPNDSSYFSINSENYSKVNHVSNTFGILGAKIADWSIQLFGISSIVFLFVFLCQILNTFKRPKQKSRFYLRLFGFPQLIICYLVLLSSIQPIIHFRGIAIYSAGIIGFNLFSYVYKFLGETGTIIAFSIGFFSSLTLALGIRPLSSIIWIISLFPFKKTKYSLSFFKELSLSEKNKEEEKEFEFTLNKNSKKNENSFNENKFNNEKINKNKKNNSELIHEKNKDLKLVGITAFHSLLESLDYHKNVSEKINLENEYLKIKQEANLIEAKLETFGVLGKVVKSQLGPVINVHEFEPASGIKVNKVLVLQDDLALALKAKSLLINLQPGKSTLSIEVPASNREVVSLREVMESPMFQEKNASLPVALGKNIDGSPLITDLCSMPHLLVAGSTGSGKSVCINTMLLSLLISKTPDQLRLILIDPKMLELSNYNDIGHLLMPVVTEPEKAAAALKWAIQEMERRYLLMKNAQVRNIMAYNLWVEEKQKENSKNQESEKFDLLPFIVVIVDELCDLMMTAPKDVEDCIQRLAQKARAAGIHLILATQRPSVDVLTGVIKANLPCRLSFQVASRHDSRTIIENIGAERLLGQGDMLFLPPGLSKVTRAQCAYVNDKEINSVSDKLRKLYPVVYENDIIRDIDRVSADLKQKNDKNKENSFQSMSFDNETLDENTLFERALEFAVGVGTVSTSSIQREFRIGYNRAARIMDRMVKDGLVGQPEAAGKPRPVIKFRG